MIYIFDNPSADEIRKIKEDYFKPSRSRYMVPILENPEEGIDLSKYAVRELIGKIIRDDNSVVICSTEFKFLLDLAIIGGILELPKHSHPSRKAPKVPQ